MKRNGRTMTVRRIVLLWMVGWTSTVWIADGASAQEAQRQANNANAYKAIAESESAGAEKLFRAAI